MAHQAMFPPEEQHPLAYLMNRYPTLNLPDPAPIGYALSVLCTRMDTRPFHNILAGASMLCHDVPIILTAIRKRLHQGKRALGGRAAPQRFRPRDLAIKQLEASQLPRQIAPLCQMLKKEMPRLFRIMLEAQVAYEDELEMYWRACHEGVGISLMRIQTLWVALRNLTTPWFALLCLRWALRCGWEAFMGKDSFTKEGRHWLGELPITLAEEAELWRILKRAGESESAPPEPFAPLIARWRAGEVPAQPPKDRKQPWPEGEQIRCRL